MASNAVGHIDIIVRKKPGGSQITVQLVNGPNGLAFAGLIGGESLAEQQLMRQIGELAGGLITGEIQHAVIGQGTGGASYQVTVTKSLSNIKNN